MSTAVPVNTEKPPSDSVVYYRLVALWVLCEAMLGGIIHGFKLPVSGLVVGSSAVICISLIGWYMPQRGAILRATVIVAIFKMLLSPHAPVTAYVAVFFQGALGELLFHRRRYYRLACVTLAMLALLESATQRILIMTLVYGKDIWVVLNDSLYRLGGRTETDYSYFIIFWYVLLHAIVGVIVGVWTGFLPQRIHLLENLHQQYPIDRAPAAPVLTESTGKKRSLFRSIFFFLWLLLFLLWLQSVLMPGSSLMPSHLSLRILIRSALIILTWYFVVGPLLKKALQKWLRQKKRRSAQQVQMVVDQLPMTRHLLARSWELSAGARGLSRITLCFRIILANTFHNARA